MNQPEWLTKRVADFVEEHGAVPPPWSLVPNSHPYEIGWRMGEGETLSMVFNAWWGQNKGQLDESERIAYLRKWPPPPRWLTMAMDLVWDLEPWQEGDPEEFDYSIYFERMESLGFGTQAEFEQDIDDPKWLE